MTNKLKDFVAAYRKPEYSEPFLGFFKNPIPGYRKEIANYYWNKLERNGSEKKKRIYMTKKRRNLNENFLNHYEVKMGLPRKI